MRYPKNQSSLKGFSLLELLAVISVMGLLATLALPAFNAITAAQGVTEAAFQTSAALETARQEAISRSTYVWVALQNENNSASSGGLDLRIGLCFSKNGTPATTGTNLEPLGRATLVKRSGLIRMADLAPKLRDQITERLGGSLNEVQELESSSLDFYIGNVRFNGPNLRTITFTPRGEALRNPNPTSTTGFDRQVGIGLRQARGTTLLAGNDAAVVLNGSIGIPATYQLK